MTQWRQTRKTGDRQRELAERHQRLPDYPARSADARHHVDALSAGSFPAIDPPGFVSARRAKK